MKLRKCLIFINLLISSICCIAQNSPTTLGGLMENNNISVSFSIGETFVLPAKDEFAQIHPGVIQPIFSTSVNVEEHFENHFTVFPNPTSGVLRIEGEERNFTNYEILTIEGKLLLENKLTNTTLDVSGLPANIYILRLISSEESYNLLFEKF